ncbi:hypothetical protein [Thauera aromatica]|uniref:hypothetical protein n=1 Tax=Thauera aromatica TaxID=59405 RepID=UPI001FFCDD78|nr:hypothetical protein [Thauera aromatica]MCK2095587.1 hypothetical protein [Thauera aromatica]
MTNALSSRTGEGDAPLRLGSLREHDAAPSPSLSLTGDDLPLLTDALEAAELDRLGIPRRPDAVPPAPVAATVNGPPVLAAPAALADELARSVDAWLERELPQIVTAELDALAARIRAETHARMRATLLPALSAPLSAPLARRAGDAAD